MEEKILIKSVPDTKKQKTILSIAVICVISMLVFLGIGILMSYREFKIHRDSYYWGYSNCLKQHIKSFYAGLYIPTAISGILGLVSITFWALFLISIGSIIITEKEVRGKGLFGQTIVLPLYKISGYYANKVFSSVDISTGSKKVKFYCIKNHKEIGEVLSKIINERQENTQISPKVVAEQPQENNLDELKKLKELLDGGVITQEEFEAKKKQLLGL